MWSKIAAGYIKRIYKVLVWFFLVMLIFSLMLFLYNVPMSSIGYAALLAIVCGGLLLFFDFLHYARQCKEIEWLLAQTEPIAEEFPQAFDLLESDYQALAAKIYQNKKEQEREATLSKEDLLDYYTLWVHQIKTPISALRLLLQTDEGEHTGEMSMELFKIEQYTEMVLQYLRLGSNVHDFVLQRYNLDDIIRQALRKYAKMFIGRKLSVDFSETCTVVLTDEKWLVFVIEQLLSNALKYTPQGKISIYMDRQGYLVIEDTGIGISAEDLPRIFEKGYTGFNGRMDKKATGLGLYLCKQVCDKLSHKITVESEPGRGTRVLLGLEGMI